MVNFNFIKKIKKCILDNMIMIHHSKKLSNRKKIKPVTYVRARARARAYLTSFFPKWPPKKSKKSKKNFFLFIWPKIHIYTKNEVFRYKTTKKTIWDCTLPLKQTLMRESWKNYTWQPFKTDAGAEIWSRSGRSWRAMKMSR